MGGGGETIVSERAVELLGRRCAFNKYLDPTWTQGALSGVGGGT